MAGAMRKVGEYLGLVEQADFDDEFEDDIDDPAPVSRQPAVVRPAPVSSIDDHRRPERRPERRASQASDLARIETVTPRTYNDARTVGEHYRSGVPVIMSLPSNDSPVGSQPSPSALASSGSATTSVSSPLVAVT